MKLLFIFLLAIWNFSCQHPNTTGTQQKEISTDTVPNKPVDCIDIAVVKKDNPLIFVKLQKDKENVNYGDSIVSYFYKKDTLEFSCNKKHSCYDFYYNSNIINDTTWLVWSSVLTIDIPNLNCFYFFWNNKDYYMLINNNSTATGIASNYYQIFIYDVTLNKVFEFTSMSDNPYALSIDRDNESLVFTKARFADEYFQESNLKRTPLQVESFVLSGTKWSITYSQKIYCR